MSVPLVEIVRSGFVEGRHHGAVVALAPDGSIEWSLGDVTAAMLPRSANKPIQALAMLGLGLDLEPELLALACSSHSGEQMHLDGVRRILSEAGLAQMALGNVPDYPLAPEIKDSWIREGREPSKLAQCCSGKHAAMVATCVARDWQLSGYFEPDHPLQLSIQRRFESLTGEPAQVAIDGCGAPVLSASLIGLARAYQVLAAATDGDAWRVAEAIRRHPEMVSGTTRDEYRLLTAIPGAIGKFGAEAVYVVALPDGRTVALKIDDGAERARPVAMAGALARLGFTGEDVAATGRHVIYGGGVPVGELRPTAALLP